MNGKITNSAIYIKKKTAKKKKIAKISAKQNLAVLCRKKALDFFCGMVHNIS